jgi:two-component system NtrC family sensor kinase
MSFRLKTILGIALIEIFLLAILVVSSLRFLSQSNEKELIERARTTAQLLSTMTNDAVVSLDLARLDTLVEQAVKNKGLIYVRIRHHTDNIMAQSGDPAVLAAQFQEDTTIERIKDGRIDLSAPILAGLSYQGRVEIGMSTAGLAVTQSEALHKLLMIAGAEIFLVGIFGFGLGTVLTRQLAQMRTGAHRVAQGEFGHQIEVSGDDEISDTARSFNAMSKALADFARTTQEARERAEAGQIYAQTILNDAMNSMTQAIVILNINDEIEFVNDVFYWMYPQVHNVVKIGAPRDLCRQVLAPYLANPEHNPFFEHGLHMGEERLMSLDPQQINLVDGRVMMYVQRLMSSGGTVVVQTDITDLYQAQEENRRLELELMQAQKMESLGTLASGIAHEINTPTQYIGDNLNFLCDAFGRLAEFIAQEANEHHSHLDWEFLADEIPLALREANEGVAVIRRIVHSVKEFSHPEEQEKTRVDLQKLIENVLTVSRNQWRDHTDITVDCDPHCQSIPCYAGDLGQVLINLIINAVDAIIDKNPSTKGAIHIRASCGFDADLQQERCVIAVADNGGGIPDHIKERICDLFFTTKAPGKGTGQGLALCKSIIEKKHGGHFSFTTDYGYGTTFIISLPLDKKDEEIVLTELAKAS